MDNSETLDWDHVYLLGWYDENCRSYLTTWDGDLPMVGVIVTGCEPTRMPLWSAPVPTSAKLHPVPSHLENLREIVLHAWAMNGYYAFGWKTEEAFERKPRSALAPAG